MVAMRFCLGLVCLFSLWNNIQAFINNRMTMSCSESVSTRSCVTANKNISICKSLDVEGSDFMSSLACEYAGIPAVIYAFEQDENWEARIQDFNNCTGANLDIYYTENEDAMAKEVIIDAGTKDKEGASIFDAYILELPWGIPVAEKLQDIKKIDGFDVNDVSWTDINEVSRATVTFNESIRALPLDTDYITIGIRQDVYDKYNMSAPKTIEEMAEHSEFFFGKDHNDDGYPDWGYCLSGQANYFFAFVAPVFQRQKPFTSENDVSNMYFNTTNFEMIIGDNEAFKYVISIYERILRTSNCVDQIARDERCDRRPAFRTGRCVAVISLPGTMNRMILPDDAGGHTSPRRYSDSLPNMTDLPKTGDVVWTPPTNTSSPDGFWGRRYRFPGSGKVWNEKTKSLEQCTKELCPQGENVDGQIINYVPFFAEGGEIYAIRASAAKTKQEMIWKFFTWLSQLPPEKLPLAGVYRKSQLAADSKYIGGANWPQTAEDDLRLVLDQYFNAPNAAQDMLILGYANYMKTLEILLHDNYLTDKVYLLNPKPEEGEWERRFKEFTHNLTNAWEEITYTNGGTIEQLTRYRSALDLPYLPRERVCELQANLRLNGQSFNDIGSECDEVTLEQCQPDAYNYTVTSCQDNNRRTITYFTTKPLCDLYRPPNPVTDDTLSCSWVPVSSKFGSMIIAIAILGAFVNFLMLMLIWKYKEHPFIRATQVKIMYAFVICAIVCCLVTIVLLGKNTTALCVARNWILYIPATFCLSILFMKVYRVYSIFDSARLLRAKTSMSDYVLMKYTLVIVGVHVLVLSIVTGIERMKAVEVLSNHNMNPLYCSAQYKCYPPLESQCVAKVGNLQYIPIGYMALIILIGCILSYQARHLPDLFCEAKYVMMAMYQICFIVVIVAIVSAIFSSLDTDTYAEAQRFLTAIGFILGPTNAVLLIVLPKLIQMMNLSVEEARAKVEEQLLKGTNHGAKMTAQTNDINSTFQTFDRHKTVSFTRSQSSMRPHASTDEGSKANSDSDECAENNITALQNRIHELEAELNELKGEKEVKKGESRTNVVPVTSESNRIRTSERKSYESDEDTTNDDKKSLQLS